MSSLKMRNKPAKGNIGKAKKAVAAKKSRSSSSKKSTGDGPQKILDFTLYLERVSGNPEAPRKRVAAMSGVRSNTFPVTISGMKKKGLIQYDKDTIRLTEAGRAKASTFSNFPMDNTSVQKDIKARFKIGGKPALLFELLADGLVHDRDSIVGGLGLKNKNSIAVMLSNLKKIKVIEYDKTTIKMTDICFPFGRPGKATEE